MVTAKRGLLERLRDVGGDLRPGDAGGIAADRAVGEGDGHLPKLGCEVAHRLLSFGFGAYGTPGSQGTSRLSPPAGAVKPLAPDAGPGCYERAWTHDTLDLPDGRRIAYRRSEGRGPGVVFLGGFRSDMTGTKAHFLEAWARARGQAYLRFDYTGHGASSGDFRGLRHRRLGARRPRRGRCG